MVLGHSEPHYELLNGKRYDFKLINNFLLKFYNFIFDIYRKYVQPILHNTVLIGLFVLILFVVILMFYVSWMKFEDTNNQNTPIDYVLFGPQKYTSMFKL